MIWVCISSLFNSVRTIVMALRQRQAYDGPEDEAMVSKHLVLVFSVWQLHNIAIYDELFHFYYYCYTISSSA